jgi:hypothetical protein
MEKGVLSQRLRKKYNLLLPTKFFRIFLTMGWRIEGH